jgi:glutathione peroxidase
MSKKSAYDFSVKTAAGKPLSLSSYKGKVTLIVNVASQCGFTPQYKGLEELYQQFKDKDFSVIGFPCNQFGEQEPGSDAEVQSFCKINYGVSFPVMAKVEVNGDEADPLYAHLKKEIPGLLGTEAIKWNFTKFLVGKNGEVLERFAPATKPEDLIEKIRKLL